MNALLSEVVSSYGSKSIGWPFGRTGLEPIQVDP